MIQLLFVRPLLRRKFTHTESLVTEARAEASHGQAACAMARAESGRCAQLPGGNDSRAEDHAYDYGQQHLFQHWTLLLMEERLHDADFRV
jgi:hypothetical protein